MASSHKIALVSRSPYVPARSALMVRTALAPDQLESAPQRLATPKKCAQGRLVAPRKGS
jgi:hypothetical protein